jgi:hypothetical protein
MLLVVLAARGGRFCCRRTRGCAAVVATATAAAVVATATAAAIMIVIVRVSRVFHHERERGANRNQPPLVLVNKKSGSDSFGAVEAMGASIASTLSVKLGNARRKGNGAARLSPGAVSSVAEPHYKSLETVFQNFTYCTRWAWARK